MVVVVILVGITTDGEISPRMRVAFRTATDTTPVFPMAHLEVSGRFASKLMTGTMPKEGSA